MPTHSQFIPSPLSYCSNVFCEISSEEISAILLDVWGFLRDMPPDPKDFKFDGNECVRWYHKRYAPSLSAPLSSLLVFTVFSFVSISHAAQSQHEALHSRPQTDPLSERREVGPPLLRLLPHTQRSHPSFCSGARGFGPYIWNAVFRTGSFGPTAATASSNGF